MKENRILSARGAASTPLQFQANPPHHILVVEDDILIRQLNTRVLTCSGYEVDAAEDGADAWNTLQLNRYDLLVTDNTMPKMSGVELLRKIHAACMSLPVIMATGLLPEEEFIRHPWLQPTATLLKPYTMEKLLGTVERVLLAAESVGSRTGHVFQEGRGQSAKPCC